MRYIDIMEAAFRSYSDGAIREYFEKVKKEGVTEHGFPRLAANLSILVASGRLPEYKELAREMMSFCCEQMLEKKRSQGNDFSVQELVLAIIELEKAGTYPNDVTDSFRASLAKLEPRSSYNCIAPDEQTFPGNWAAFNACSEWMRVYAGICKREDAIDFIDFQLTTQLLTIDENGMYRDPHEPILYDIVPRKLFAMLIKFGYDGRHREKLIEILEKSAKITLEMQSVTGEMAFGGRSNQFLHNEAWTAAIYEFYASYFAQKGDIEFAGQFKRAAALAKNSICEWLELAPGRHVKNRFSPQASLFGCEGYAYYDKYMITLASLCYQAELFSDDSIPERPCPAETANGFVQTSEHFHKIFMRYGDYMLELDTNADTHYDASGLGRVHKRGAPGTLCLSVPFPGKKANYLTDGNPFPMSICGFCDISGEIFNGSEANGYEVTEKNVSADSLSLTLRFEARDGAFITEKHILSNSGLDITVSGTEKVGVNLPVFMFDGEAATDIALSDDKKTLTVTYAGHACKYQSSSPFNDTGLVFSNRNGRYKLYRAGNNVKISM